MRSFVIGLLILTLITVSACSLHPSSAPSISGLPQAVAPLVRQTGQSPADWEAFQAWSIQNAVGGLAVGADGNIWFTILCCNSPRAIGKMTMAGTVTTYTLPQNVSVGALVSGPKSALWFPFDGQYLGSISTSGVITSYEIPIP